jgi:hypothetical protein
MFPKKPDTMKNLLKCLSILLIIAGLNDSLTAQQYYNYNNGTGSNSFPFNVTGGKDVQLLYLPGAFNQPTAAPSGNITTLYLRFSSAISGVTYTTLTIKMGQSTITNLTAGSFYTGSMTTVYTRASVVWTYPVGWGAITLDTPFPYDPTQSLIVDIGQCGASAGGGSLNFTTQTNILRVWSVGGCPFVCYAGSSTYNYDMGFNLATAGPPVCVTTAATSVTGTTAQLNGTVNANGSSTTVTFEYGPTTAYGTVVPGVPPTATGTSATTELAAITGLTPLTLYHFRVNGVNASGTTNGNDMTFTTGSPPPTVVTTAATLVGLNNATLNGTVNANSASTTVTFQYGLTIAYGNSVPGVPSPVTGNTVTPVSAAITGLIGNQCYHYRVVGVSSGGTSNGNDMTFCTAGAPIVVTDPATNVTQTTAQLNGTVTANNLSTTVSFNWGLTTAYGNNAPVAAPVTGNTATPVSANISGLTNLVTYHYQCVGVNAGGTTLGADKSFQTGCTPPAAPGSIAGPVNVCQGGCGYVYSIAPIPGATSYTWTVPVGGTITSGQGTNSISVCFSPTALYGFVTVAGIGTCGNGPAGSMPINVYSPPVPTITGPAVTCPSSGNVYYTQFGFTNFVWTVSAGGVITSGQGTYSITVDWITCGAQSVSVNYNNLNGCPALAPTVYPVTVNCAPVPTITGPNNVCPNAGNSTYTTQPGFSNYVWTVSGGGTLVSGQGTNTLIVTWTTAGAQTVSVNYTNANGCPALSPTIYPVTVNALPGTPGTITGTATVCAGTTGVSYSVAPVLNAVAYVWTLPPGASNSNGNMTSTITVDFASNATSGAITVNGNNLCGNGNPSPAFNVTVNALPEAAGPISGDASVCIGESGVIYSVVPIVNATSYVWTVPAGASITSGGTTSSITVSFGPTAVSGNITVKGTNSCGDGNISPNFAVMVSPIPPVPVITINGSILSSNAPSGNQWYMENVAIPGATGQTYTAIQTGHYWDIVTLNTCSSDTSNHIYFVMTGILDLTDAGILSVYPNPSDGMFTIVISSPTLKTFTLSVINNLGLKIIESRDIQVNGKVSRNLDLRSAPEGVYTIILHNDETHVVKKIIINK